MKQEEIDKMFEGRWRFKSTDFMDLDVTLLHRIKDLCRDFFEAGTLLFDGSVGCGTTATYSEVCDVNAPFEQFWNLYDKKVGKPKAEKLWHKLSMSERISCLNYIPLYKQAQPDKQFRKNPETFLRNKSWNDELIYRSNGNSKPTLEQQQSKLASILTD